MEGEAKGHSLAGNLQVSRGLVAKPLCLLLRPAEHQGRNTAGITSPLTHCLRDNPIACASELMNSLCECVFLREFSS